MVRVLIAEDEPAARRDEPQQRGGEVADGGENAHPDLGFQDEQRQRELQQQPPDDNPVADVAVPVADEPGQAHNDGQP